jgi:hypothetical protein
MLGESILLIAKKNKNEKKQIDKESEFLHGTKNSGSHPGTGPSTGPSQEMRTERGLTGSYIRCTAVD